jgi:hypothetical protein
LSDKQMSEALGGRAKEGQRAGRGSVRSVSLEEGGFREGGLSGRVLGHTGQM